MPEPFEAMHLALSYLDEIESTLEIRQSYTTVVVGMAGYLMPALKHDPTSKDVLRKALSYKTVDAGAFYKCMVVQCHGVFENYIRSLVKEVVKHRIAENVTYTSLGESFRKDHIYHAALILRHIKSGSIMGDGYDFDALILDLKKALNDEEGYNLSPEIYTKLMGNCTSDRIESLFTALGLPDPFSDVIGTNVAIKKHFSDRTKGRVSVRAKEKLDDQIRLRNRIVHGELTVALDENDLRDNIDFFRSLISGLSDVAVMRR